MSKEKRIEEMQLAMLNATHTRYTSIDFVKANCDKEFLVEANALYNAGYRKQSEWISVDERLPRSQQMVLCYTPCDGYIFVGYYQKVDSPYWKSYWNIITAMRSTKKITKKVTHWMPLPEPPKMKGGAE